MYRFSSILAFSIVVASYAASAQADGGKVQFSQVIAPYRITVFTSPTPIGAGMIDISVLVQDADSGRVVQGAVIDLELRCDSPQTSIIAQATSAASTNKLLHSAKFALPTAGVWHVSIQLQGNSPVSTHFDLNAYGASGDNLTVMICLAIPFIMIALFSLREHLVSRKT